MSDTRCWYCTRFIAPGFEKWDFITVGGLTAMVHHGDCPTDEVTS